MNLIDKTGKYAENIRSIYDELKKLETKIQQLDPSNVRKNYDKYWDIVNKKEIETNEEKEELDESINNLEDGKELLDKIGITIQNVKNIMNSFRVGTLQGISKQTTNNNNMTVNPGDEIGQNVMDQPYNELEDINRNKINAGTGGKRYKKKSRKNKRSRSNKRSNKRSKKRINKYEL